MKAALILRQLSHICLSSTCLVLVASSIAYSAILKDVRMGDHDAFTRVVLEFDADVTLPAEIRDMSGLVLTFPATKTGMVRKIPNYQSSRVDNFTLWEKKEGLSIKLAFDFEKFRYEFLELPEPYRLVIDIFPKKSTWTTEAILKSDVHPIAGNPSRPKEEPVQVISFSAGREKPIPLTIEPGVNLSQKTAAIQLTPQTDPFSTMERIPPENKVHTSGSIQTHSKGFGLHSYLIIGLVVITIIILFILVIMMLTKYRWSDNAHPVNIDALLQKQEDHIASINARIKEQLKRYDEA
jgi:hypothetical protein